MNDTTRAYIAGFFDGEGCVSLSKRSNTTYGVSLTWSQKRPRVLYYIQEQFLRVGITSNIQTLTAPKSGNTHYRLSVNGKDNVSLVLKLMAPYNVVKKVEVDTAIKLVSMTRNRVHVYQPMKSKNGEG